MESWILNNALNVEYKLNIKRIVEYIKQNYIKIKRIEYCYVWLAIGKKTVAFDFSHHGHALVTLYVQFLCSDRSKFDWWVRAENLYSILKLVFFDGWSLQSLCQFVMFLTVFFHWMYKMKFSCYQESSVIHGELVLVEKLMHHLSKSLMRFRMASFRFSPCLMRKGWKVWSDTGLPWYL